MRFINTTYLLFILFLLIGPAVGYGQNKKLAVIGSSTAFGTGAQPIDSSWVRRINHFYKYQNNVVDTVYNIALGGYDPYHGMPSSYVPAAGYANPDPLRNITKANSFGPDVIIVSFVSNNFQVGALPMDSIMKAFQLIKDSANKEGRVCFISTSQPRTSFDNASRARLGIIKDSIINRFGFYAINFFDSLVNLVDNTILPAYASPFDNIHLNNAGHAMLYRQVLAKDIFNITINRTRKSGNLNDPLTWDKGIVPTAADSVAVLPGHTISVTSSAQLRGLSVAAGGTLQINSAVELTIGDASIKNHSVSIDGSLSISNGKLIIYGNLKQAAISNFSMSGGELIIDGNTGIAGSSVIDGVHLFDINSGLSSFSFSSGTLQIINPPLGANSQSINCAFNFGANSIVRFGNGISTIASNNLNGFGGNLMPAQVGRFFLDAATPLNNRIFKNLNPLTVNTELRVLSGNLVEGASLTVAN